MIREAPVRLFDRINRKIGISGCDHEKSTTWECTSPRITPLSSDVYYMVSPRARVGCIFTLAHCPGSWPRIAAPLPQLYRATRSRIFIFFVLFSFQGATSRWGCNYKFRGETKSCRIPTLLSNALFTALFLYIYQGNPSKLKTKLKHVKFKLLIS